MIKRQRKRKAGKKAFTLVELIFEIVVITLLVVPMVLLLGQLTINIVETEVNSTATLLGIQKSEELLLNYDFDTISNSSGNFSAPYASYSYQVTVRCVDPDNLDTVVSCSLDLGYKKITITVSHSAIENDIEVDLLFVDI